LKSLRPFENSSIVKQPSPSRSRAAKTSIS